MAVYLTNYFTRNYRSLGGDGVRLEGMSDINIIIGQNNGGKSNILRSIQIWDGLRSGGSGRLEATDYFDNDAENKIEYEFVASRDRAHYFDKLISADSSPYARYALRGTLELTDSFLRLADADSIRSFLVRQSGSASVNDKRNLRELERSSDFQDVFDLPPIVFVPETRVRQTPREIRDRLEPIWNHGAANKAFGPIRRALKEFIEAAFDSSVEIQFEPGGNSFSISTAEDELITFDSLGSGFRQIFSLALVIASTKNSIVMIDEPELNLHPALLKRLMKLILSNTTNQYIIASHSSILLDGSYKKSIYSVAVGRSSGVKKINSLDESRELLDDLGVKASDILQANGIIWVEGPSDRTYIKKWFDLKGATYQEGLDYTFQYYGGKLLAHYAIDDDIKKFVSLLDVNRNAFVVMDSDWKDKKRKWSVSDLAPRKRKIIEQCEGKSVPYWVSSGVEIENYLPNEVWTAYAGENVNLESFENIVDKVGKYSQKASESHKVAKLLGDETLTKNTELDAHIDELLAAIEQWNSI